MKKPFVSVAILAAGIGSRMGGVLPKQNIELLGKTVLRRSLEIFEKSSMVDEIIVAVREDNVEFAKRELSGVKKTLKIVIGGNSRAESAKNAFSVIDKASEIIAFHDAARFLVSLSDAEAVISDAIKYGAATASTVVTDTVKEIDGEGFIKYTHNRESMRFVGTPQAFDVKLYQRALDSVKTFDATITDDNMLMERIGVRVYCTVSSRENIKITTKSDLAYAEFLLKGEKL